MGAGDCHEVEGASRGEHAIGCGEGYEPGARQTGGDRDKVLLGHADIEEALRERVAERQDVGVFAEVGGKPDNLGRALHQGP